MPLVSPGTIEKHGKTKYSTDQGRYARNVYDFYETDALLTKSSFWISKSWNGGSLEWLRNQVN